MKTGRKGGPTAGGYRKNRKWLSSWEFLVYFILVPAILIAIQYLVPYHIKDKYFILHINNPTPWAMFLTNYVHTDDPLHLWGNITSYLIVILYIFKFSTNKKETYAISATFFFFLPFVISYASIMAFNGANINTLGFSGIVAAFIGYFPYVFYRYVKSTYSQKFNFSFPMAIGMISLLIALIFDYPTLTLYIAVILLSLLPFIYTYRKEFSMVLDEFQHKLKELKKSNMLNRIAFYGFYAVGFFLLFFSLRGLIKPPTKEDFSNIIAHFVGYFFGFFVPLATFEPFYYIKGGARDA